MKVYGDLQAAALETLASDPSGSVTGRIWWDSTALRIKLDDGTNKRAVFRNDQKIIIGNNGTAASNVRFNRAAAAVLQLVLGDDVTAEGSLSTALAQLSSRVENYTDAGKPAAGNAGRVIYLTDVGTFMGDNGSAFLPLGGGGAGGSLKWIEAGPAPTLLTEANVEAYGYSLADAGSQALYAIVRVPSSYVAGRPISLKIPVYSVDASGTFLIQSVATLIRVGTDTFSSTTNQRTSTNAAITATGGNQNIPQSVVLDLTSTIGQINAVSVTAGDYIIVKLQRGSDTAASEVRALTFASEVTLT